MNSTSHRSSFLDDEPPQEDVIPLNPYGRSPLVSPQVETALSEQDFSGAYLNVRAAHAPNAQSQFPGASRRQSAAQGRRKRRVWLLLRLALIVLLLAVVGALTLTAYSSGNSGGLSFDQHRAAKIQAQRRLLPAPPTPLPRQLSPVTTTAAPPLLQLPLPPGWAQHSPLDAENALQVAWTFTQREMRIDYRNVGTRARIGGTLVAAVFLLDAHAAALRFPNDRRSTAAFFLQVEQEQLIQTPVFANPPFFTQPRIVQAHTMQDGNFFVWADIPFELLAQRGIGGQPTFDLDPQSQQPRVHTLQVLLITVPPGLGPMAGIDFEVSDYALDPPGVIPLPAQP